jgi:hypothetical protein
MENFENQNSNETLHTQVQLLERQIVEHGIDTAETEEVVKLAHLLFGEERPEHEVEAIIENFYKKEQAAANEADKRAE